MTRKRRPFTLADLLLLLTIAGLLVRTGLPQFERLQRQKVVTSIILDVNVLRAATSAALARGVVSRPDQPGHAPREILSNLPAGFALSRSDYSFSLEPVALSDSAASAASAALPQFVAVGVTLRDSLVTPMLVNATRAAIPSYASGRTVTLIFRAP